MLSWSNEVSMLYQMIITQLKTCMLPSYKRLAISCIFRHSSAELLFAPLYCNFSSAASWTDSSGSAGKSIFHALSICLSLSVFIYLSALPPFLNHLPIPLLWSCLINGHTMLMDPSQGGEHFTTVYAITDHVTAMWVSPDRLYARWRLSWCSLHSESEIDEHK